MQIRGYHSAKKKEILPLAITWVNLEDIRLSEIIQLQKNKYRMAPFILNI